MEYEGLGELSLSGSGGGLPGDLSLVDGAKPRRNSGAAPKPKAGPGKKLKTQDLDLEAAQFKLKQADKYAGCSSVVARVSKELLIQLGKLDDAMAFSLTETSEIPEGKPVRTSGSLQHT